MSKKIYLAILASLALSGQAEACAWQYYAGSSSSNNFPGTVVSPARGSTTISCVNPRTGQRRTLTISGAFQSAREREVAGREVCCDLDID